jgi:hypothetical protein
MAPGAILFQVEASCMQRLHVQSDNVGQHGECEKGRATKQPARQLVRNGQHGSAASWRRFESISRWVQPFSKHWRSKVSSHSYTQAFISKLYLSLMVTVPSCIYNTHWDVPSKEKIHIRQLMEVTYLLGVCVCVCVCDFTLDHYHLQSWSNYEVTVYELLYPYCKWITVSADI